jgi:hypothetical protein
MAWGVAGFDGSEGSVEAAAGNAVLATRPAVIAPLAFRNSRRLVEDERLLSFSFMKASRDRVYKTDFA